MKPKKNYAAWTVDPDSFPYTGSLASQIEHLLRYAVLAPSTHNTQPWVFASASEGELMISPNYAKALPEADKTGSGLYFSLGCALMNIMIAANHFGLNVRHSVITVGSDQTHLKLEFIPIPGHTRESAGEISMLHAIQMRRSHKLPFKNGQVSTELIARVSGLRYGDAHLNIATDKAAIHELAELHFEATMTFADKPKFSKEVSSWMRPNHTGKYDGMPGFTFGLPAPLALLAKTMASLSPKSVGVVAKRDRRLIRSASGLGLISTLSQTPESWINAGMLYQHVGLIFVTQNVLLAPKAAAIQSGNGEKLNKVFLTNDYPQLYFAFGYGDDVVRHSPRRGAKLTNAGAA